MQSSFINTQGYIGGAIFIETVDENLKLGPKLIVNKRSKTLAISLWNLVIIAYSRGGHVDQFS